MLILQPNVRETTRRQSGRRSSRPAVWSRLAGVYSVAKRREDSQAAIAKAVEIAPNDPTMLIDMAESEVWLRHNARSARELLTRARQQALSDLHQPFLVYTDGLIQLEEGRPREARELLQEAYKKATAFRHATPLMEGRLDRMEVPLVLACAAEGDLDAARRHYQSALPRMRALKCDDEIARCEAAIAQAAGHGL